MLVPVSDIVNLPVRFTTNIIAKPLSVLTINRYTEALQNRLRPWTDCINNNEHTVFGNVSR